MRVGSGEGLNPFGATLSPDQQASPGAAPPGAASPPRWSDPAAFAATAPPSPDAPPAQYRAPDMGSGQYRSPEVGSGQYRSPEPAPAQQPSAPPPQAVALAPSRTQAQRDSTPQDPEQLAPNAPAALAGFLVSYDDKELGQFWPVNQGHTAIGRKGAADGLGIEIDHPTTSSRHAVLMASARPARIKIEDQGSTNGTFVNDHKLETGRRQELRDGDIVRFGGFVTIVKII